MILSSVKVAEWPPFGKELLIRFTVCSLSVLFSHSVCLDDIKLELGS